MSSINEIERDRVVGWTFGATTGDSTFVRTESGKEYRLYVNKAWRPCVTPDGPGRAYLHGFLLEEVDDQENS